MNVASLGLCKELYGLSGWDGTQNLHGEVLKSGESDRASTPAYDLGYLMQKLPYDSKVRVGRMGYYASWSNKSTRMPDERCVTINERGYSAEDAVCKLAIELFKQGILKREATA